MNAVEFLKSLKTELPKMATWNDGAPVDEFFESLDNAINDAEAMQRAQDAAWDVLDESAQYTAGVWLVSEKARDDILGI